MTKDKADKEKLEIIKMVEKIKNEKDLEKLKMIIKGYVDNI